MDRDVKAAFEQIKFECRPNKDKNINFSDMFDMFFGSSSKLNETNSNFIGGVNDGRNTLHENLFATMHPHLKQQVHFGTGPGGHEKYLSKRYTVDFYDEQNDVIYEIDGESHKNEIQVMKDRIRDFFFFHELGIKTIRITNSEVEEMVLEKLNRINDRLNGSESNE